jgi:hypothetical protein
MDAESKGGVKTDVQYLAQDIAALQRSIQNFEKNKSGQIVESGYQANKRMQILITLFCLGLFLFELIGTNIITKTILEKNGDEKVRWMMTVFIGFVVIACLAVGRVAVSQAAKSLQDDLENYLKRNFSYLRNQSHSADMLIKYVIVAMFILGQKPDWIAPMLFIFTGDYLFQSRYFTLPPKFTRLLGLASIFLGALQFSLQSALLIFPLAWFFALNVLSLFYLKTLKRVDD